MVYKLQLTNKGEFVAERATAEEVMEAATAYEKGLVWTKFDQFVADEVGVPYSALSFKHGISFIWWFPDDTP